MNVSGALSLMCATFLFKTICGSTVDIEKNRPSITSGGYVQKQEEAKLYVNPQLTVEKILSKLSDDSCTAVAEGEYFATPNYPEYYPENLDICWAAACEPGTRVMLKFAGFDTQDPIYLYDGDSFDSRLIATLEGDHTPTPEVSIGSDMLIRFVSDDDFEHPGFNASYTCFSGSPCINVPEGKLFTSPNYPDDYEPYQDLCWEASCPPDTVVILVFHDFCFGNSENNEDYMYLYDGNSVNSSLLATLRECDGNYPPQASSGTDMIVHFRTDRSLEYRGFNASYTCFLGTDCISVDPGQYFKTLRYPSKYPNSFEACWEASCEPDEELILTFQDFCTESGHDGVQIYDGAGTNSSIIMTMEGCSTDPPEVIKGTDIVIAFSSDESTRERGFLASYECIGEIIICHTVDEGEVFNTTGYPFDYPDDTELCWEASCANKTDTMLVMTFHDFCTESGHDYVQLYSDRSTDETFTIRLEGCNTPPPQLATGSEMRIRFISDSTTARRGFSASYQCVDEL